MITTINNVKIKTNYWIPDRSNCGGMGEEIGARASFIPIFWGAPLVSLTRGEIGRKWQSPAERENLWFEGMPTAADTAGREA